MRTVRIDPLIGLVAQLVLLATLAGTVGLGAAGWAAGIAYGLVVGAALTRGLAVRERDSLGPADRVTLARATLVGCVTALVADAFDRPVPVALLVWITAVALALDAVDGWVARRTGTASALGARFDMEVDAFLILVLSVYVARSADGWVLAIGAARYAFVAAGWLLPWLRGSVPPRYWRKVVAAVQGVTLAVAATGAVPPAAITAVLAVALALLAESFGRDIWWLWRHRPVRSDPIPPGPLPPDPIPLTGSAEQPTSDTGRDAADHPSVIRQRVRTAAGVTTTVLAALLVWYALLAPDTVNRLTLAAFIRVPIEGILLIAVALVLPPPARRVTAVTVGAVLGLLIIVKTIDMGFIETLDRPFNPVTDWSYLGPAAGVLSDSIGRGGATVTVVVLVVAGIGVLIATPLAVLRLTRLTSRHRTASMRTVTAFGAVWVVCAALGARVVPGAPIASTSAAGLAYQQVRQIEAGVTDQRTFAKTVAVDPFRDVPGNDLLTGLRGKDVVVAFVESYGRVAVQGSTFAPQVDAVLNAGTTKLRAAGYDSRSAFLTSPTFGGISWLAHSTLQSGLWIDSQQRYNQLVAGNRFTLSDAFGRAGWRTVADIASNHQDWSVGTSFYHYDTIYDDRNVGYLGPAFSYAAQPDQYIMSAFQRMELDKPHAPVMAEIDLVSSHTPWAPLPHMIGWDTVGDGSVYDNMPQAGRQPDDVWRTTSGVQAAYGQSIEYSLNTLISFLQTYHDKNLVLIVLGDHQPATIVSGPNASHDVPITIIADDPAVLARISGWGWQNGMLPDPQAPVWPMDTFRDRFLTAYGPQPTSAQH